MTSNSYDSAILNVIETPLPPKEAKIVSQEYIATEEHYMCKLIQDRIAQSSIVYYVPRRRMRVIAGRATMLAGDRS